MSQVELSIIMPCLNEVETLDRCIRKAQNFLSSRGVAGEVIVADNGSVDGSRELAEKLGARVVTVSERGYGSVLQAGISAARGTYVVMGDSDDSYDFGELMPFLEKLREGNDLVMGNRFKGGIRPGAMPPLHRYLGNPVLTGVGRLFFSSPCGDFHCGLRGFRKEVIQKLDLRTTGMEFASEMVVKSALHKLRIAEVPIVLSPDGRSRPPHLRTWRDGWRHLRFLLLYSPRWLFLYPGMALMLAGLAVFLVLLSGKKGIFDIHTLLFASAALAIGFQTVLFAVFAKAFAISEGLLPNDPRFTRVSGYFSLEAGLIAGAATLLTGLALSLYAVFIWKEKSFGDLDPIRMMRIVIPAITCLGIGVQIVFASFFLSLLGLKRR